MQSDGQRPRILVAPERESTYGDLAAAFAADYGLKPDPWQQLVLDDWLAMSGGRWASLTCGLSVPRQNGKNGALEVRELFGMVGLGERFLHTAHEVKTAQKHFRRLKHFFGRKANDPGAKFPELNKLVAEVRNVNGQEAILLTNGGSVEIVARSTGSARGYTVDVIVCDEAQSMSDESQEALLSTSSAAPSGNPQWIYTGTPPGPRSNGEVFARVRAAALQGAPGRLCWHEWSAEDGADLDDRLLQAAVNPGLITGRLLREVIEGERASMSDEGFGRERMGIWETSATKYVIDPESWESCADELSVAKSRLVLGVDVNPERTVASVGLAGERDDGRLHLELVETRRGTAWLAGYIADLCQRNRISTVVVDKVSPAASLIDDLARRRVRVTATGATEMGVACAQLFDGVMDMRVVHINQPQLTAALAGARRRTIGQEGLWGWNRRNASVDITPLVAVTLAAWGVGAVKVKSPTAKTKYTGKVVAL